MLLTLSRELRFISRVMRRSIRNRAKQIGLILLLVCRFENKPARAHALRWTGLYLTRVCVFDNSALRSVTTMSGIRTRRLPTALGAFFDQGTIRQTEYSQELKKYQQRRKSRRTFFVENQIENKIRGGKFSQRIRPVSARFSVVLDVISKIIFKQQLVCNK